MPDLAPELKMERSPLQFVLVQVRFSPVKLMSKFVPELQERLRRSGFPGYSEEAIQQITIGPEPSVEATTRWAFISRDKRQAVVLASDFVVFETSQYEVSGTFLDKFCAVLATLNDIVGIEFVSQIGLRYVDVIGSLDGHLPTWFVRPQIQGLTAEQIGAVEVTNQFLSLVKTSEGLLRVKSLEGKGPGFMPPDLEATRLEFDLKLPEGEPFRILDFDHIWKGEMNFIPNDIIAKMRVLHVSIKKTFKETVTEQAIGVWMKKGEQ